MELKFLGRGSSFNPQEGNTSAYFIEQDQLFLIDIGESVFERLIALGVLDNISQINLMITHTHSDHIGSIGSLAMYSYFKLGKPLNILTFYNDNHLNDIENILQSFGCTSLMYEFTDESFFDNKFSTFQSIRYVETDHYDGLTCYGLLITTEEGLIYYSGDTRDTSLLKNIIASGLVIDKLYIDTTTDSYPGNVHFNIGILNEIIPEELKNKVYCMHLNSSECEKVAKALGFNIVSIINVEELTR